MVCKIMIAKSRSDVSNRSFEAGWQAADIPYHKASDHLEIFERQSI
jgi:hypothetical protein